VNLAATVPLIVNSPKLVPGGRTLKLADFSDLLPTFCELTGARFRRTARSTVVPSRRRSAASRSPGARGCSTSTAKSVWSAMDASNSGTTAGSSISKTISRRKQDLRASRDPAAVAAKRTLQAALDSFPADAAPPFALRSQSIFRARHRGAAGDCDRFPL
jgi:hypothetical protein